MSVEKFGIEKITKLNNVYIDEASLVEPYEILALFNYNFKNLNLYGDTE